MKQLLLLSLISAIAVSATDSIHAFQPSNIDGDSVDLATYRGTVVLIVNTASRCGFTKQYKELVALQDQFAEQPFAVLAFPANQFGKQEPGSNDEIKAFCSSQFQVDFPLFAKSVVKGQAQTPLFAYLTTAENPDISGPVRWNFEKFLVGKDGKLLRRWRSKTKPTSAPVVDAIKEALAVAAQ